MESEVWVDIEKTYEMIKKIVPLGNLIDSLEVVKQVEEYRQFWKPKEINVVLLAESHVYTDEQDYRIECKSSILDKTLLPENPSYPVNFVKFIYCLGYGENKLLIREIDSNKRGTPDFWKIFSNCVSEYETKVLKMEENLERRLRNKVNVLRKMQERGIWLLDASIIGLTKIKSEKTKKEIIKICWDNHLAKFIRESKPNYIIVIGRLVAKALSSELQKLKIPFKTLPQPRGQSVEYFDQFRKICEKYC